MKNLLLPRVLWISIEPRQNGQTYSIKIDPWVFEPNFKFFFLKCTYISWKEKKDIYIYKIGKINVYNINARVSRRKFISARFFVQFYMAGLPFITEEKTSVAKSHLFIPDHHRSHFEQDRGCARFDSVSLMSSRNEMGYPSSFYSAHVLMHSSTRISW